MTFKQYNPSDLRKLQLVSTTILAEFDRVCEKLGIPYFIYAGTAIGAVRHSGFIPWDDDIDIAMFRPDYERFLAEAPGVLKPDYFITNGRLDPDFPACNSNLSLRDTYCVPQEFAKCKFQYPIGIGIFALDRVSEDKKVLRRQLRSTWIWARLSFLRQTGSPIVLEHGWKRNIILFASHLAHGLLSLFHVSPAWIHANWENAARLAEKESGVLYADFTDRNPLAWTATKEEVFPLRQIEFENISVKMANKFDDMLHRGYGDYMQLPPEEDRKNHYPSRLEFGKFA